MSSCAVMSMQEAADADNKAKEEEEDAQETVGAFNGVQSKLSPFESPWRIHSEMVLMYWCIVLHPVAEGRETTQNIVAT